jgi:hypothetical protein
LRSERTVDRRRAPRRIVAGDEPLSQVRLRAGRQLAVIDICDTGLMAEGEMRLLPGTHVDVHLVTSDGRLLVRSRVVRAFVSQVSASTIRYRGALVFERPVRTGYAIPEGEEAPPAVEGNPYPSRVPPSPPRP